jgi:(2S)-methylsuccinyl-CoA dehydrogenase
MTDPDLTAAASVIETAHDVVARCTSRLAEIGDPDANQVVTYDLAHAAAAVETGRAMLTYGARGDLEARLTCAFVADAVAELAAKVFGREAEWGVDAGALDDTRSFVAAYRAPEFVAALADTPGPRHLDPDFEMVQDTFRRFGEEKIAPVAEHIHRHNSDIPEDLIQGLAEMGGFGLSVPVEYDGFSEGGESEYIGMVVATEELSRT